ncbi:CG6791 [Drosophila busckii]|uniref:CG6791 n=1 Tax=Drosophila busckii TaxID=30019 RepID=A0A0M4F625_DROBS|nr:zinc finger protein Xfin [Drosophila busckii]ALC47070.1 CG6791 [Drosophila busckii]
MEGMDLWTRMFSADDEEGGEGDAGVRELEQNDNNTMGEDVDEYDDDDDDEEEESKGPEPDDDAIFNFELSPIVNSVLAPAIPSAPSVRPIQRQSLQASFGSAQERINTGTTSIRPKTSQINATDENGVLINYELGVIYICPACGTEFRQQDMWKRHMNNIHQFNTRRGLNFVAIDKLYQRCLECNKRIAMHSRENLLKHKFTHLPYRCTKCYICKREYKYRQDLMVHLRMVHYEEVVILMREGDNGAAGRKTRVREPRTELRYPDDDEGIEVRNELLEPDAIESANDEFQHSSSTATQRQRSGAGNAADFCEDYIHYMCPDCGTDCETHAQWSQHIEFVHDYVSRRGLNFRSVDMQMQCLECKQFVSPNTMKTLRVHKFSHLSQPEWMRCKLCYKGYTEHQELVSHLLKQHHLETLMPPENGAPVDGTADGDDAMQIDAGNDCTDELQMEDAPKRGARIAFDDMYEPHIDYLCPQCGREFIEKKQWRNHVEKVHGMNDLSQLNFKVINDRQLKCTECDKIITNAYGIQNAQQHRITHLPYKSYIRCRKCHKSYTDRKGLVKHLATNHRIGYDPRRGVIAKSLPRKQIVTVANETYEIIYLDEDDQATEENDFAEQMQADPDDDFFLTLSSISNRYKCVDCGTLFATSAALKTHISEEHDFSDTQYSAKNAEPVEDAEAAIPTSTATTTISMLHSAGNSTIEQNYIFLCPSCGETYKSQFEWRRHINEAHNFDKRQYLKMRQVDKYRYQCTLCKDIVCNSKLKGLQDHHFRHLAYRLYLKCLICGTCYNHKPNIAAHLRTRHNIFERESKYHAAQEREGDRERGDTDRERGMSSASSSPTPGTSQGRALKTQPGLLPTRPVGLNTLEDSISYHNAVDLDFITYYCPKCNQNFDSHAFWRKHIVEQHNFNSRQGLNFRQLDNHHYLCLECYKRVTVTHTKGAIGQLQSHKFRHLPYRSFKCLTCNGEFVRKQMFFKHLNRNTNRCDNRPQSDNEDEQSGGSQQPAEAVSAEAHIDIDPKLNFDSTTAPVPYRLICPQCGDSFSTSSKSQWREHINIYHGMGKRETLHMRKVGGDDLYRCSDCDQQLQTKQLRVLQQHRFMHLPHSDYIRCLLCVQGTSDTLSGMHNFRELQQHMRQVHVQHTDDQLPMQLVEDDSLPYNETEELLAPQTHLLDDDIEDQYLLG